MQLIQTTRKKVLDLIRWHKLTHKIMDAYIDEEGVYTCIVRDEVFGSIKYIGTKNNIKIKIIGE